MPRLYRSSRDLTHWFVFDQSTGWMSFPARIDGWSQRRAVASIGGLELREVPLWLAFNTGLIESSKRKRLARAA